MKIRKKGYVGIGFIVMLAIWTLLIQKVDVFLLDYMQTTQFNRLLYWTLYILLILLGILKITLNQAKVEKGQNIILYISLIVSIMTVAFLSMTRLAYATTMVFLLLIVKGILLLKIRENRV